MPLARSRSSSGSINVVAAHGEHARRQRDEPRRHILRDERESVEVDNTDAEGRLVLAGARDTLRVERVSRALIDVARGHGRRAGGGVHRRLFSASPAIHSSLRPSVRLCRARAPAVQCAVGALHAAGEAEHDRLWRAARRGPADRLQRGPYNLSSLPAPFAHRMQTGGMPAGSCRRSCMPTLTLARARAAPLAWVHVDMAGTMEYARRLAGPLQDKTKRNEVVGACDLYRVGGRAVSQAFAHADADARAGAAPLAWAHVDIAGTMEATRPTAYVGLGMMGSSAMRAFASFGTVLTDGAAARARGGVNGRGACGQAKTKRNEWLGPGVGGCAVSQCADVWDQRQRFIGAAMASYAQREPRHRQRTRQLAPVHNLYMSCRSPTRWSRSTVLPCESALECLQEAENFFRADRAKEETTLTTASLVQSCDSDA
ncbi:hypothetical protein GGX14DRAFT_399674 [Mycena pura]|uniref:Cytosol aminopeptidase domain-containing protein n=1 Tax=Mycena pura TaxID=153505 RepID=A0AAD6V7X3_9AGAR|nr:hypothetical protein GGX14DRAFT_399674 [Mycena pura]